MCSTESREDADLPLGRSALASHACTHLILGPHGSFDGSTRNEQPSACGYSCPHDPIARGTSTSRQTSPVDASPGTRGAADRPQGSDGVAPMAETLPADTAPRRATHAVAARARGIAPRRNSIASRHTRSTTPDRYAVHPFCSGVLLPIRCAAPDQVRCSRSGAVPARRHSTCERDRFPPIQRRVAPHTRHYTRSVCSTPFLFRCAAPDQVRCSRSGAVPARRHGQAAEALCASVLESARAQASAGARDRSALSPFDRTARPRRHLPSARKASRQSLQPGYETPPPSG